MDQSTCGKTWGSRGLGRLSASGLLYALGHQLHRNYQRLTQGFSQGFELGSNRVGGLL